MAEVEAARRVAPRLASVQNRFSLYERGAADRATPGQVPKKASLAGVIDYCAEHGLAFIPHGCRVKP